MLRGGDSPSPTRAWWENGICMDDIIGDVLKQWANRKEWVWCEIYLAAAMTAAQARCQR